MDSPASFTCLRYNSGMLTDIEKILIREHYQQLASRLPNFRPRAAQRRMLAEIANAFSRSIEREPGSDAAPVREGESIVIIEGPTGVGKSLAYLIAGGVMAQCRGKKLVISSATIALQEQLINRDLPFVLENSGLSLKYALAKGRGRYICPYYLFQLTADTSQGELLGMDPALAVWERKPEPEEIAQLRELADAFYYRKWDGDMDTWPESISDAVRARVVNDRHGCLKASCPNRSECPFFLAREILEQVDVVVANHDLLLADTAMGGGVILPAQEQSFFCIDEAHKLAKKAINQFAAEHGLNQALGWLDRVAVVASAVYTYIQKEELVQRACEAATAAMETLTEWLYLLEGEPALAITAEQGSPLWLMEDGEIPPHLKLPVSNQSIAARMVFKHLSELSDALNEGRKDKTVQEGPMLDKTSTDLGILLGRAEQMMALWDLFEAPAREDHMPIAKWITRTTTGKGDYIFCASPVSAAVSLRQTLWSRVAGALLTSATLRSLGEFDLLLKQTGLKDLPKVNCVALDSPFNFTEQAELYLPQIVASPKDPVAHTQEITEWLPKLIDLNEAVGTLVLFSSRKQMQDVASSLDDAWKAVILMQGDSAKSRLLEKHAEHLAAEQPSVIFGLDSFAEGLDLPGNACVQVIIARLPFSMPDDPVDKTLSRWIERQGGNPFFDITVPEASIKLVQAVGRLIRTENDYGRVTILDHRISRQTYGKKLLAALPPFRRV